MTLKLAILLLILGSLGCYSAKQIKDEQWMMLSYTKNICVVLVGILIILQEVLV